MLTMMIPLLITTSSSIYGWNAMYAASNVPEMEERAFAVLAKKSAEKCGTAPYTEVSLPEYAFNTRGPHYVEHAYVFITCGKQP